MRRKLLWTCLFGTVVVITGCGGGGGGGGGSPYNSPNPILRQVPYSTPVRVGSVTPINSTAREYDSSAMFTENLSGTGEELITAGRSSTSNQGSYPTSNLNVFGWSNGTLVNQTSQWFSGTDNVILGTEPSVKFADFDGDGRKDMYVAPNTDASSTGSGWVFFNNGTRFTRVDLNLGIHGHDSAVYDINGDGRSDIFTTGSRVSFGNADRTFTTHAVSGANYGGTAGSVAIADFMGTGGSSIILTDQNAWRTGNNRLYSWSMVDGGRSTLDFRLTMISALPDSRFLLPKWSGHGFAGSHDYRALAFDFDNSGLTSAVIFSRPLKANGTGGYTWPEYSEIQFLKNRGGGTFVDVTDSTLVGYNTASSPSYNPKLMDVNNDGLIDIVLGGTSWTSATGAQVLIHTKEHKYVASYSTVLDAFLGQSLALEKAINASAETGANGVVFVRGPDGNMYLATAVSYVSGGVQQKAIYLSKLGSTVANAQATAAAIKQAWPWMSDGQINTVLAQSSTTWFGMNVLDPEKAFQPIGNLGIPLATGGIAPIRGYITGLNIGDGAAVVTDSLGRAFSTNIKPMNITAMNAFGYNTEHNDQYELTSHAEYLVNGTLTTVGNLRFGSDFAGRDNTGQGLNKPKQYTVGVPRWYSKGNWSAGTQYTYLNSNPWMAFGGAWGEITGSGVMDNVITYRRDGFSAQASAMHVTTNITPGLITRVNNMWGAWAESGYRFGDAKRSGDMGIYAGIKPVVLSGSVEARIPTAVDMSGNVVYTNKKLMVQNQTTGYLRALYTNQLDRRTQLRLSAVSTTAGQYRAMTELKFWID
jgi:hypothetical protein